MRAIFLLSALLWTLSWAQESPVQWLQRAQQAEETLTVAGARTVEIIAGRRVQRIEERFWRQGIRAERIEILAPPERQGEVLLYRGGRWLVMRPNAKEAFEMPYMPVQGAQLLKTAIALIQRGVVLAETLPDATVLGRSCVVLRLRLARPTLQRDAPPRPMFPATVTLWLDKETGLALKREIALRDDAPVMRMELTRLELNPRLSPELFALPPDVSVRPLGGVYETVEKAQRAVSFPIRTPSYLPAGAKLERVIVQPRSLGQVVVLQYRAPSARFSIFQAYKMQLKAFGGKQRHEPPHARFWRDGDYWFGIVGSLPKTELERIAQSLGAPNSDTPATGR
jgi:outer membrane lipoprotein-sorting protein